MIEITSILDVKKYIYDVDVVLFDLDDTLYSEKDYVRSGYRKISEYFNNSQMEFELWNAFLNAEKAIDIVLDKYGLLSQKNEALNIYRYQTPEIFLYQGVFEMIEQIRKVKKVGIVTDGRPEGQSAKIKALGIKVDKIIITDELGGIEFRKPNKIAFLMMQQFFDVPFEKMMYVGDNISKDFVAPEELGMKSLYFKNKDGIYYDSKG